MKHHIVIYQGERIVENMMSNISSAKELRARLAKKWPGKRSLYFRIITPQRGWFSSRDGYYSWYIDSNPERRQRKPEAIPEMRLVRNEGFDDLRALTQNPRCLYEGDVFTIPPLKSVVCMKQQISPNNSRCLYYVKAQLNDSIRWLSLRDLKQLKDSINGYEVLKFFAGKTVKINKAVMLGKTPCVVNRGLLTGKPLTWMLRPAGLRQKHFEYEIIE